MTSLAQFLWGGGLQADRGYIRESGRTILEGSSVELLQSAEVRRTFLGG